MMCLDFAVCVSSKICSFVFDIFVNTNGVDKKNATPKQHPEGKAALFNTLCKTCFPLGKLDYSSKISSQLPDQHAVAPFCSLVLHGACYVFKGAGLWQNFENKKVGSKSKRSNRKVKRVNSKIDLKKVKSIMKFN